MTAGKMMAGGRKELTLRLPVDPLRLRWRKLTMMVVKSLRTRKVVEEEEGTTSAGTAVR